jgi:uncharacterized protein YndB with AHSA1/START domain
MAKPLHGLLLIADITGYTVFLRESELEHAQAALSALLEVLVEGNRPPLTISRLEGDAVFSYVVDTGGVGGQTFVELVEDIYVGFRRALDLMVLNTSCPCNACANIGSLDLKFFVHFGQFALQDIGKHRELVGADVNLAHRLTKNTVTAGTGLRAYALYTAQAIEALALQDVGAAWTRHSETYVDVGTVECRVQDLHPVWTAARERAVIEFEPREVLVEASAVIAASPEVVWDRLADPTFRAVLMGSDRQAITDTTAGRTGPGSVFQCYHGDKVIPQLIVEWRPFTRVVTRDRIPLPGPPTHVMVGYELDPVDGGTRLRQFIARPTGPALSRLVARFAMKTMRAQAIRDLERFRRSVEDSVSASIA